jgi:hypothetical protein
MIKIVREWLGISTKDRRLRGDDHQGIRTSQRRPRGCPRGATSRSWKLFFSNYANITSGWLKRDLVNASPSCRARLA